MATTNQAAIAVDRGIFSYTFPIACGTISGECCECAPLVPGRYATAVTLLNTTPSSVRIFVHVAPTTLAGATAGRWPDSIGFRGEELSALEPARATTIDCCTAARLSLGAVTPGTASATYGVVFIQTTGPLEVSATYTSVGAEGTSPSIHVEIVEARELMIRGRAQDPGRPAKQPTKSSPPSESKPAKRGRSGPN